MRLPKPPPDLDKDDDPRSSLAFSSVKYFEFVRNANRRYSPWDELSRRPFPPGLEPKAAWRAISLIREFNRQPLPKLLDVNGRPFGYWLNDAAMEDVLQIEAAARDPFGFVEGNITAGEKHQLFVNSTMEESIHSSLLEGAATTRKAAKEMLRRNRRPRSHGEKLILNNFHTMLLLDKTISEPLTTELILRIHQSMTAGTLDNTDDEGRLQRPEEERVIVFDISSNKAIHRPPPANELGRRLQALCDFANSEQPFIPSVVRATFLHFQLGHDHPFADGNGRTARALFYWLMLRKNYDLFRFMTISRVFLRSPAKYARAYLHTEQTGDLTYFLLFNLKAIRTALDDLGEYLARKRSQRKEAAAALRGWGINLRQQLLISRALVNEDETFTATTHMTAHGITRATALSDLRGLVRFGLLEARKIGKEWVFWPAPNLGAKLQQGPQ